MQWTQAGKRIAPTPKTFNLKTLKITHAYFVVSIVTSPLLYCSLNDFPKVPALLNLAKINIQSSLSEGLVTNLIIFISAKEITRSKIGLLQLAHPNKMWVLFPCEGSLAIRKFIISVLEKCGHQFTDSNRIN